MIAATVALFGALQLYGVVRELRGVFSTRHATQERIARLLALNSGTR